MHESVFVTLRRQIPSIWEKLAARSFEKNKLKIFEERKTNEAKTH